MTQADDFKMPMRVRVIEDTDALLESERDLSLRTPDAEVRARLKAVRDKLYGLGSHRDFSAPPDWRRALDALEAEMPNFHAPVRMIRNTLGLVEATGKPMRIPPMLLVGPPGLGKTYFSHKLAEALSSPIDRIAFDQPSAGSQLAGSDAHWSNTQCGVLFKMVCLGTHANPIILLDEIEKASFDGGKRDVDPLSQLHSALEPETSRRFIDQSTGICFDASYTTYIATANSLGRIGPPILSRFEIFQIGYLDSSACFDVAAQVARQVLEGLQLSDKVRVHRRGLCVLAHLTPRLMHRTVEKAVGAAVADAKSVITEDDICRHAGLEDVPASLH